MLTTVVGNYPKIGGGRAPNLRTALNRYDRGEVTWEEVERVAKEVTKEVLEEQAQAGVDLVTDGHIRWEDGQTYFARRIAGFSINGLTRYFDNNTYFRQPVVEGRLHWQGPISVEDFTFARSHSSKPVKPVVTGPYTLARLSILQGGYPDIRELALDLAEILNQEARALEEAGATLIQFDEPAILRNPQDFPVLQEASQRVTQDLSAKTAIYTYFRDVAAIAPDFFTLPFQVFGLDFVSGPRNWELLKDFPSDKELGLGVVDARNTRMETVEEIVKAVQRAAEHVSPERLYVNPSAGLEYLPRKNAYQKLCRLVEGVQKAREVMHA